MITQSRLPCPGNSPETSEQSINTDRELLAGIEYHGIAGATEPCQEAIVRLLQCAVPITKARIISADRHHGMLLITDIGDPIAIKAGFASGYGGTGPTGFSLVLLLLLEHGVEIDEYCCDDALLERLDRSALTLNDLEVITNGVGVRPSRWYDYVQKIHEDRAHDRLLWHWLPPVMPYSIIDGRIMDLAINFWADADGKLLKGYRRLEDRVRERTGLQESSAKLFSRAFLGVEAPLTWLVNDKAEREGRANLFTGAFMAFRNPRAHRETVAAELLVEFLLLNQLFKLEAEAIDATG